MTPQAKTNCIIIILCVLILITLLGNGYLILILYKNNVIQIQESKIFNLDEKSYHLAGYYITEDYMLYVKPNETNWEFYKRVKNEISEKEKQKEIIINLKECLKHNSKNLPRGILISLQMIIDDNF